MSQGALSQCPKCQGKRLVAGPQKVTRELFGRTYVATIPGTKCRNCGEVYFDATQLHRFELGMAADIAQHGPATGESLSWMRRALGLSGEELAELLQIRSETLSRWETGKRDVDPNAWLIASSLVLDEVEGRRSMRERMKAVATLRRARRVTVEVGADPRQSMTTAKTRCEAGMGMRKVPWHELHVASTC